MSFLVVTVVSTGSAVTAGGTRVSVAAAVGTVDGVAVVGVSVVVIVFVTVSEAI